MDLTITGAGTRGAASHYRTFLDKCFVDTPWKEMLSLWLPLKLFVLPPPNVPETSAAALTAADGSSAQARCDC